MSMATSYSIGKHFEAFIEQLIASGRYSTASEIIRDGLRLIEERDPKTLAAEVKARGRQQMAADKLAKEKVAAEKNG
jgi:antitoxin ParD1/3/4